MTLGMARPATAERSGRPAGTAGAAAAACAARRGRLRFGARLLGAAQPPGQHHAADEAGGDQDEREEDTAHQDTSIRLGGGHGLGQGDRQDAVTQIGGDGVGVHRLAKREDAQERAVAPLDLVVVARGALRHAGRARAANRQPVVLQGDVDLLARQPRQLGGDDVAIGGFVDVHRRRPRRAVLRGEPLEPFLPGAQVPQRIARHAMDRSTRLRVRLKVCAAGDLVDVYGFNSSNATRSAAC